MSDKEFRYVGAQEGMYSWSTSFAVDIVQSKYQGMLL